RECPRAKRKRGTRSRQPRLRRLEVHLAANRRGVAVRGRSIFPRGLETRNRREGNRMRLIGKDFDAAALIAKVRERLGETAGSPDNGASDSEPPEAAPDPERFYVDALERHADPREGTPLETHRTGVGRAVLAAKWAFR